MGLAVESLKSEREKRKIPLAQIAKDTHISLHYLQCLEEGRYKELPGGMYNRAFLRAYCESLNLDRETLKHFEGEVTPPPEKAPKSRAQYPGSNTLFRSTPIIAWSLMLLISATGLFFSRKWIAAAFSPYFSQSPVPITQMESSPVSKASLGPETSVMPAIPQEPIVSPDSTDEDSLMDAIIDSPPPAENALQPLSLEINPPPETEGGIPSLSLEFEALDRCWISIDNDRGPVIRRLLEPGEAQAFSASEEFFIIVGNAGGIQLKINGKRAKPLGESGEVVRIRINEETLPEFLDQTAG